MYRPYPFDQITYMIRPVCHILWQPRFSLHSHYPSTYHSALKDNNTHIYRTTYTHFASHPSFGPLFLPLMLKPTDLLFTSPSQILGVAPHIQPEGIHLSYTKRAAARIEDGYSLITQQARLEILKGARDVVSDPVTRAEYIEDVETARMLGREDEALIVDVPVEKVGWLGMGKIEGRGWVGGEGGRF